MIRCMCENTRCDFKLYQKHTENFEFIISPFWLEMLNFKCLPRPEMDINIGNGQVGRLKLAKSGDDRFEKPNSDEVEKLKRLLEISFPWLLISIWFQNVYIIITENKKFTFVCNKLARDLLGGPKRATLRSEKKILWASENSAIPYKAPPKNSPFFEIRKFFKNYFRKYTVIFRKSIFALR